MAFNDAGRRPSVDRAILCDRGAEETRDRVSAGSGVLSLLAGDIPVDLIKALSGKGIVSLDVQGYLRKVENKNVCAIDWLAKREALRYVNILKANESEMKVLTGHKDVRKSARMLADWGVKEVVITLECVVR